MNTMFDVSFGLNGIVTTDFNNTNDQAVAIGIQSNGKIILAGTTIINSNTDFGIVRYNTNGTIDNTFGINGTGKINIDTNNKQNILYNLIVLDDDKIILCGKTSTDITLIKLNNNGIIDTSFGSNGKVITNISLSEIQTYSIGIQSNNKIIVGGTIFINNYSEKYFFIMRYNPNGTIDTSFGNGNGYNTFSFNQSTINNANNLYIQNDDKIILCGQTFLNSENKLALLRLTSNGFLDASFGSNGKIITTISFYESLYSVIVQSDNKILVTGEVLNTDRYDIDMCIIRYLPNGIIDTSFGNNGIVITNLNNNNDTARSIVLQSDKILIAGFTSSDINDSIALARYTSDGVLDNTFGLNGIVITNINGNNSYAYALKIQPDKKILICGYNFSQLESNNFTLIRLIKDKPTAIERKNQGATIQDLIVEGYSRYDILNANYTPNEYASNGFTPTEIRPYFSDYILMLQTTGFSPNILKEYGIITNGIVYFNFTIILNNISYQIIDVCYNLSNEVKHIIRTINNGIIISSTDLTYSI